jgi:tetratricopeptide (TPR) repeat protein
VFVFFRPDQEHSLDTLRRLAQMETELAGKSVRWVAIVSGDYPAGEVRQAVREAGIRMPVLVDRGNAFYGKLGVRLQPVVGIAGADHRLAAYEHFVKVNMGERVRARIRRILGEITDADVDRVLEPPTTAVESGPPVVSRRYVKLARALLEAKATEKAKQMARKALEADAGSAAAHAVLGEALAAEGKCAEAEAAFAEALRLDPREPAALAGRAACAGKLRP